MPPVGVDWARETGFADPAFYASGDPLPSLPDLTGWDGAEAVAELCAALPGYAGDLAGQPWHAYADDAPERVASILGRIGAANRLAEIFVPAIPGHRSRSGGSATGRRPAPTSTRTSPGASVRPDWTRSWVRRDAASASTLTTSRGSSPRRSSTAR